MKEGVISILGKIWIIQNNPVVGMSAQIIDFHEILYVCRLCSNEKVITQGESLDHI